MVQILTPKAAIKEKEKSARVEKKGTRAKKAAASASAEKES
jgi:hypothetical protein